MRLSTLVLTGGLLLGAETMAAQADPISGTWNGDIGLTLTERHTVKFELKFDGRSGISGTVTGPGPADFKTGTFDPTTGALKFEIDVRDDGGARRFTFEGTAISGMATGRVYDGSQIGSFRITRAIGDAASATPPDNGATATELARGFAEVSVNVAKAADLVPADKYSYRPAATVRTFGELIGHVADSYVYYCGRAAGQDIQWSDAIEKGRTDKATLLPKLRQAQQACGSGKVGALIDNIGHTNLHYGNMITYLRMLGLTPPSS